MNYLIKIHSFQDNKDMLVSSDIWQHEYQGDPKELLKKKPALANKLIYKTLDDAKKTLSKIKKARGGTRKTDSYSLIPIKESIEEAINEAKAPIKDLLKKMPSHVKGWARYVAQHKNGEWWYYNSVPKLVPNVGWKSWDTDGYQFGSNIKTDSKGWESSQQKINESINESIEPEDYLELRQMIRQEIASVYFDLFKKRSTWMK